MTSELYTAAEVIEVEPQGAKVVCGCWLDDGSRRAIDWNFWPQVIMLEDEGYVAGPRSLCGTRDNPGLYAHQTLIWAYCGKCRHFYGGIYKPDRLAKTVHIEVVK